MSRAVLTLCLLYAVVTVYYLGCDAVRVNVDIGPVKGTFGGRCVVCYQNRSVEYNGVNPCEAPCGSSSQLLEVYSCIYTSCEPTAPNCEYHETPQELNGNALDTCRSLDFSYFNFTGDLRDPTSHDPRLRVSYRNGTYTFTCTNGDSKLYKTNKTISGQIREVPRCKLSYGMTSANAKADMETAAPPAKSSVSRDNVASAAPSITGNDIGSRDTSLKSVSPNTVLTTVSSNSFSTETDTTSMTTTPTSNSQDIFKHLYISGGAGLLLVSLLALAIFLLHRRLLHLSSLAAQPTDGDTIELHTLPPGGSAQHCVETAVYEEVGPSGEQVENEMYAEINMGQPGAVHGKGGQGMEMEDNEMYMQSTV